VRCNRPLFDRDPVIGGPIRDAVKMFPEVLGRNIPHQVARRILRHNSTSVKPDTTDGHKAG
jgi:hypothetical protein